MGVFNQSVNFAAIGSEMAKSYMQWLNGSIQIVDPNTGEGVWDEWANTYTGGEPTVLWSGPARIQHLRSETLPDVGFSQVSIRGIRVQVPLDVEAGFIRKGLQIIITDGGNDYELEQLQFIITSAINSSYAWGRTIEAEVDVKSIANSTWSGIAGTVTSSGAPLSGVTVRTFHHEDNLWILDYETTTDVLGNYELPADAGVEVAIVASLLPAYVTEYYDGANSFDYATTVTPVNHEEMQGINFDLVLD
jgi:Family of unknown function (DUF6093)